MTGMNEGWIYLTNAEAATPFSLCVLIFALFMIPGGRIQDKFGPKVGAITGGLFLALGCIIAGVTKSYAGLIIGFGILGGIGMGIGYAAPTPAALKWFGPHKRGLIAGLVVGGYGGAALYISPLAAYLLSSGGITYSFVWLGIFFAIVVIIAGSLLAWPPAGYVPPAAALVGGVAPKAAGTTVDWVAGDMMKTWQFFALVFMFIVTTQSGLMIIANAAKILAEAAKGVPFLVANAWILVLLRRRGQRPGPGGHRYVFRQNRPGQCLLPELPGIGPLYVPDALDCRFGQRLPAVCGHRHRLLAVWRRSGPDAVVYRRLLRPQKPGLQLRPGVHRLGFGLLHGQTGRHH